MLNVMRRRRDDWTRTEKTVAHVVTFVVMIAVIFLLPRSMGWRWALAIVIATVAAQGVALRGRRDARPTT